jgi:hypothetical protein
MTIARRRAALAGALTAALVLTGCGGGDGGSDEGPEPSSTETADLPTDGTAPDYLETPEGVELTEPGTELSLDEDATAAWTPRQDLVAVVDLTVTAIERASLQRDFAGYGFEGVDATSTPYFVRADVTNVGDTDLGGRQLPIYGVDDAGRLVEPSQVDRAFKPCPGSTLPAAFSPDDATKTCLVYLVARGSTLEAAMFRPPEGVAPLTWTGAVTAYQPPKPPKPPKKPKKNRNR